MRATCATAASRPRIRPIAEDLPESRYRRLHFGIFGVSVFVFVAYLMDFIAPGLALWATWAGAVAATIPVALVVLRRLAGGGQARESGRVFLCIAGLYVTGGLLLVLRIGAAWPFGAELALLALVWSTTLSGAVMALTEPLLISRIVSGEAAGE